MIVVDANIVAYWAIEGEYTALARSLREIEPVWVVPLLCRHELTNVIATYARHEAMSIADVEGVWRIMEPLLSGHEYEVDVVKVIELAAQHGISAYDAQYWSLAQVMNVPLLTQDRKLIAKADIAISLSDYLKR